jgi:hypothetical protein
VRAGEDKKSTKAGESSFKHNVGFGLWLSGATNRSQSSQRRQASYAFGKRVLQTIDRDVSTPCWQVEIAGRLKNFVF